MGFFSFLGRVLFASLFILSAYQMFESTKSGFGEQEIGFVEVFIYFIFLFNDFGVDGGHAVKELIPKVAVAKRHISSRFGVEIPDIEVRHIAATTIFLKGVGGIFFVFGNSFGAILLVLYLVLTTPLLHDFYNYGPKDTEFVPLLHEFLQCVALFGALLYFIGMKNSILKRQHKKKAPKAKTV